MDQYGNPILDQEFIDNSIKEIPVLSGDNKVALKYIILPEWYIFLDTDDAEIFNNEVTVRVKKHKVGVVPDTHPTAPDIITQQEQHENEMNTLTPPDLITVGENPEEGTLPAENNKIKVIFVDEKGNDLKLPNSETVLDANKKIVLSSIKAPKGFQLANNDSATVNKDGKSIFIKIKKNSVVTKPSRPGHYVVQRVRITFVDQNSKALVGYKQVTGKDSFSTKIEAPKGYAFVNDKDATIKFDKKGNKDINVSVKLMTTDPIKSENVVTTNSGSYKNLYTLEGKMITSRALGANSKWYTDQYAIINGTKMYRVATNEWVKASDVH